MPAPQQRILIRNTIIPASRQRRIVVFTCFPTESYSAYIHTEIQSVHHAGFIERRIVIDRALVGMRAEIGLIAVADVLVVVFIARQKAVAIDEAAADAEIRRFAVSLGKDPGEGEQERTEVDPHIARHIGHVEGAFAGDLGRHQRLVRLRLAGEARFAFININIRAQHLETAMHTEAAQ